MFQPQLDWTCIHFGSPRESCVAHLDHYTCYVNWTPQGYRFRVYDTTSGACIANDVGTERHIVMLGIERLIGAA